MRYLQRTTGYSRQQLTRLIRRAQAGPLGKRYRAPAHGFARHFTDADVALLAATDTLHGRLSGPATRHLMQRALRLYGDTRYARLATISTGHLYNLRKRTGYTERRRDWTKTRPTSVAIGERRAPAPDGRPGFIRIDSVHQGDQDGLKGVYHLNAVDCLTQWELVATCEKISEAYRLPVLETLLAGFPFRILGFHADNGSEYINPKVATLLDKLRVEFTKSRPRHSNDNGLAETKNGAVVRKHLGYAPATLCHSGQRLLHRLSQRLPQLPSAVPLRRGDRRQQRPHPQALPAASGHDATRETGHRPERAPLPAAGHHAHKLTTPSAGHFRQRGGLPVERSAEPTLSFHPQTV